MPGEVSKGRPQRRPGLARLGHDPVVFLREPCQTVDRRDDVVQRRRPEDDLERVGLALDVESGEPVTQFPLGNPFGGARDLQVPLCGVLLLLQVSQAAAQRCRLPLGPAESCLERVELQQGPLGGRVERSVRLPERSRVGAQRVRLVRPRARRDGKGGG